MEFYLFPCHFSCKICTRNDFNVNIYVFAHMRENDFYNIWQMGGFMAIFRNTVCWAVKILLVHKHSLLTLNSFNVSIKYNYNFDPEINQQL